MTKMDGKTYLSKKENSIYSCSEVYNENCVCYRCEAKQYSMSLSLLYSLTKW